MQSSSETIIELAEFDKGHPVGGRKYLNSSLGDDQNGIAVSWKNLKYSVQLKGSKAKQESGSAKALTKDIIHGVSGCVRPGQMLAILGGSGAGKSTLLDILANRKSTGTIEGTLAFNGAPLDKETSALLKRVSGYVTQEDVFLATQTVSENLRFFAKLTMANSTTAEQEEAVVRIMDELNISHLAGSRIGGVTDSRGLSGGEKKRVAIAEQLLRNPLVLYLDEPTSGLDAYNSQQVMSLLRSLCERRSMTIIASIHQPRSSIYSLFDQLCILDHGRTAYFGSAKLATPYFASLGFPLELGYNPPDFFIDVVLGKENSAKNFPALFDASHAAKELEARVDASLAAAKVLSQKELSYYAASYPRQLLGLLSRWFYDTIRNPEAAMVNLLQAVVLGCIVGSIFYKLAPAPEGGFPRAGLLFFALLSGAFPITNVAVMMVQNRAITNREMASGVYSVVPLWLTRILLDFPVHFLLPVLFNSIVYWMAGLNPSVGRFFINVGIMILNCWCAGSLYTVLGAISPDPLVATIMSFTLTVILMLFGGFFTVVPTYWVWLEYISFVRWTFVALMANEFGDAPGGDTVLALFDLQSWSVWQGVVGLVCQIVIYRALALVCMAYVNREKR